MRSSHEYTPPHDVMQDFLRIAVVAFVFMSLMSCSAPVETPPAAMNPPVLTVTDVKVDTELDFKDLPPPPVDREKRAFFEKGTGRQVDFEAFVPYPDQPPGHAGYTPVMQNKKGAGK